MSKKAVAAPAAGYFLKGKKKSSFWRKRTIFWHFLQGFNEKHYPKKVGACGGVFWVERKKIDTFLRAQGTHHSYARTVRPCKISSARTAAVTKKTVKMPRSAEFWLFPVSFCTDRVLFGIRHRHSVVNFWLNPFQNYHSKSQKSALRGKKKTCGAKSLSRRKNETGGFLEIGFQPKKRNRGFFKKTEFQKR